MSTLPTRTITNYFNHPNQTFLRREALWTFNYFFKTRGVLWLVAYVALLFGQYMFWSYIGRFDFITTLPRYSFVVISFLPFFLIKFPLWLVLFNRRVLAPFRGERCQEILATPASGNDLWPGLLVAPVLGLLILGVVAGIYSQVQSAITWFGNYAGPQFTDAEEATKFWHGQTLQLFVYLPLHLIFTSVLLLAVTSVTARYSIPNPTILRRLIPPLIVLLVVGGIISVFQYLMVNWMVSRQNWPSPLFTVFNYVIAAISYTPAYFIARGAIKHLRSEGFRQRLLQNLNG